MNKYFEDLTELTIGKPQLAENLTVIPLLDPNPRDLPYRPLDEAIADGSVRITEISGSGSVPQVRVVNDGDTAVLLLDGEELVGCKQNRVLNLTILVPPKATLDVPVSCVEQGRWHSRSESFRTAPRAQFAHGRAGKVHQVTESMKVSHSRSADQGRIWADIGCMQLDMGVDSATGAMADAFDKRAAELDAYLKPIWVLDGQVGAIFAINGRVLGAEVFGSPELYRAYHEKIVNSYALDALANRTRIYPVVSPTDARKFFFGSLERPAADTSAHPALGLGKDIRIDSKSVAGAALKCEGHLVHVVLFDKSYSNASPRSRGSH
jgi:hypothetical protein